MFAEKFEGEPVLFMMTIYSEDTDYFDEGRCTNTRLIFAGIYAFLKCKRNDKARNRPKEGLSWKNIK